MATFNITNGSKGLRFIGAVSLEAGETMEGVELSEDDALLLGDLDGVTVEEVKPKPAKAAKPEAAAE